MFGFINVNKQSGVTSHKIISVLRKITGIKQIGHAGTLDPLASGVLPVAVGKATKLIDYLEENKSYRVDLSFGKTSDTYDIEGTVEDTCADKVSEAAIIEALKSFRGEITQIPPAFSAVHYNGKRLYELARSGKIPDDIPSRKVNIFKNEIVGFDFDKQILTLDIDCSKGTYIRSIVNDLGNAVGAGAVMSALVRTKSSGMKIENSIVLSDDTTIDDLKKVLINPVDLIELPKININEEQYKKLLNGNRFCNITKITGDVLLVKDNNAVAFAVAENEYIQPKKVLL